MKSIFTTYTTAICILSFTLPGVRQEKSCPSMQPPLIEESLTMISQQYHMISHHHKFTINTDLSFLAYSAVGTCAFLLAKFIKIHFVIHIYQKVTRSNSHVHIVFLQNPKEYSHNKTLQKGNKLPRFRSKQSEILGKTKTV